MADRRIVIGGGQRHAKIGIQGNGERNARIQITGSGNRYPFYNGPTTVTPEAEELQILQTEEKIVMENIVVLPIPYYETSNPQGGITVYIGD